MTTLVDFLLARLADDEKVARVATPGPWRWHDPFLGRVKQALVGARDEMVVPSANGDVYPSWMDAAHIARHDPARVLAECDAKRRIVEEAIDVPTVSMRAGRFILRLLALPYADHPDYDERWRP